MGDKFTPQGIPLKPSDLVQLSTWNIRADTYVLSLQVVDMDGNALVPLEVTNTTNSDRSAKSMVSNPIVIPMRIIGAALTEPQGTVPVGPGETFVQANVLGKDQKQLACLFSGYFHPGHTPSFPASIIESSLAGAGRIYNVAPSSPAAGAEVVLTVPAKARWRVMSLNIKLVASSAVANRTHHLTIDDGTTANVIDQGNGETPAVAASTTRNYIYQPARGVALETAFDANNVIRLPIVNGVILTGGSRISTVSTSLQAGDQYSIPQLWVEEWIQTQ